MTTGEKIRAARKKANLTQKRLGELCGIAEPTIRKYESDRLNPKAITLRKIAKALHVDWLDLFDDSVKPKDSPFIEDSNGLFIKKSFSDKIEQAIRAISPQAELDPEMFKPNEIDTGEFIDLIIDFTQKEKDLFKIIFDNYFYKLNEAGQQKAADYVEDLAGNEKYRKPAEDVSQSDTPIDTSADEKPDEE